MRQNTANGISAQTWPSWVVRDYALTAVLRRQCEKQTCQKTTDWMEIFNLDKLDSCV